MALTYTYVDLANIIKEIADADLNFAGNWSSGSTYFFGDVTLFNDTRYISLAASKAQQPPITEIRDEKWSALVLAVTGSSSGTTSTDAFALAAEAYTLATYAISIAGTAGGGGDATYAYNVALTALHTAWAGTSGAHEAYDVARTALETSWVGTAVANQSYTLATYAVLLTGTATSSGTITGTLSCQTCIDSILTTIDGNVVVNNSGNVVTSGGF
jgi:hypothetical protein